MKRILFLFLLLLPLGIQAQNLSVCSFNLRYVNDGDASRGNGWADRCPWICSLLRFEAPDLIGTQELYQSQIEDMEPLLPEYAHIGVGRDDGADAGEHSAIWYRRDRFKLLRNGDFWLSETPEVPSKGWDAALKRICSWGCFKDKVTHKKIWMFNLHNDHVGVQARAESAKLVVQRIREMCRPGETVFLTGDFNVDQTNEIYLTYTQSGVLADSYETASIRYAPNGTINKFDPASRSESRIDHVFVSPRVKVVAYGVLTETWRSPNEISWHESHGGDFPAEVRFSDWTARTLSDHFPVIVKVQL